MNIVNHDLKFGRERARDLGIGTHVPYLRHVDEETIVTKSGLLLQVIRLSGLPLLSIDQAEINARLVVETIGAMVGIIAIVASGRIADKVGRRTLLGASAAAIVVFIELWAIAFIQNRYMETPFWRAALQVVLGGALVFAAGVLIGGG